MKAILHVLLFLVAFFHAIKGCSEPTSLHQFIQVDTFARAESTYLDGSWYFHFGELLAPEDIPSLVNKSRLSQIQVPGDWKTHPDVSSRYGHGHATYALAIVFSQPLNLPLALYIPYIQDAYSIYWVNMEGTKVQHVAATSNWHKTNTVTAANQLFFLPQNIESGWLVIHVKKSMHAFGGFYGSIELSARSHAISSYNTWLAIRATMIGGILVMFLHYFVQFLYLRNNRSALFLSLLCGISAIRSLSTSGIADLLLNNIIPFSGVTQLRLEYLTLACGITIYVAFCNALLTGAFNKHIISAMWFTTTCLSISTLILPISVMTDFLYLYQLHATAWSGFVVLCVLWAAMLKTPYANIIAFCSFLLASSVVNDIFATQFENYSVYIIEFSVFFFLIFHAHVVGKSINDSLRKSIILRRQNELLTAENEKANLQGKLDYLTGLFNRKAFDQYLDKIWEKAKLGQRSISIILLDIDHFKNINDTHGHLVGDEVLVFFASTLRAQELRPTDLIARFGGEEFMIILPDAKTRGALIVAEKLRSQIESSTIFINKLEVHCTASFGVYCAKPSDEIDVNLALEKADKALYKAKSSGRNCVCCIE